MRKCVSFVWVLVGLQMVVANGHAVAQKLVTTYYDSLGVKQVHERYYVNGEDTMRHGSYEKYFFNGSIALTGTYAMGSRQGLFTEYYQNGQKRLEATFANNKKNGPVVAYYDNGAVMQRANFLYHKLTDSVYTYYPDGRLKSVSYFNNDYPDGPIKDYWPNGKLKSLYRYKNSKPNGLCLEYYETGVLALEANYSKGFLTGNYTTYWPNGKVDTENQMADNEKNGQFKSYNEAGVLIKQGNYKKGFLQGLVRGWYDDGKPKVEANYLNGKLSGITKRYYPDGKNLQEKLEYLQEGKRWRGTQYWENGKLKAEIDLVQGEPINTQKMYDAQGTLRLISNYDLLHRLSGEQRTFDSTGKLQVTAFYQFGQKNGLTTTYYPSGKKTDQTNFKANRCIEQYMAWHENGSLKTQGGFNQYGNKHGKWEHFSELGALSRTENWRNGNLINSKDFSTPKGK